MKKEFKVISEKTIELLEDDLNSHGSEGWTIVLSIQEYGYTKVLLEREK